MNKYRNELEEKELKVAESIESEWNGAKFIKLETGFDDGSIRFVFYIPEGEKSILKFYDKALKIANETYDYSEDQPLLMGLGRLAELNH